jgi:crotonobetainyl-CoA:carnitine CoA-transferase CaiB-like acyl-CoA transferase
MCRAFGFADLLADARLSSNNERVRARDWLLPALRERFAPFTAAELAARFEANGLPYAPITQPQELIWRRMPARPAASTRGRRCCRTLDSRRLAVREGRRRWARTRTVLRGWVTRR